MNRDMFNEKKKLSNMDTPDASWAEDVSFKSLEKKIKESKKASEKAFLSLDGKEEKEIKKSKLKEQAEKREAAIERIEAATKKKPKKGFIIFLVVWAAILLTVIGVLLYRFYFFLGDYEEVYQASLPYHVMDDFFEMFDPLDFDSIYAAVSDKPEINEFETGTNVENYYSKLLEGKEIAYVEATESTDKNPVYHITADNYIVGQVNLIQTDEKRKYDLPIYRIESFDMYSDAEFSVNIQAYTDCEVYVNDIKVSPEYVTRLDLNKEKHFEGFTELPLKKYYQITGFFEKPTIKVVNGYGQKITPTLNNNTGVYETPISAPKEVEEEMKAFATEAVHTYAQVVCREINDSALDKIFTKNNMIVSEIKSNSGNLKYFPNHTTESVEDKIIEFIPYSSEAFYCEIEHTQHMLIYGVRPRDVVTDARFYYYKEDGEWKVCAMVF
ncbi:hypothetical protein SAMN04487760_101303 [Lachnospiraceae bacterium G41]|nr:hypothetical protein SAMN04487760_101303 [Lachnospiraceae bacterium G41]